MKGYRHHPHDAGGHVARAPPAARTLRRRTRPDAGDRRHDRRGVRRAAARARNTRTTSCRSSSKTRPTRRCTTARPARRSSKQPAAGSTPSSPASAPAARSPASGTLIREQLGRRRPHPRGRAFALARAQRRPRGHARHPGHRRELRARRARPGHLRRDHAGRRQGRDGHDAPRWRAKKACLAGISAGANVFAARKVAERLGRGQDRRHDHLRHRGAIPQCQHVMTAITRPLGPSAPSEFHCATHGSPPRRSTMSVNVYIPTPFRHLVGNRANVKARGATVSDVLARPRRTVPRASTRRLSMPTASARRTSTST